MPQPAIHGVLSGARRSLRPCLKLTSLVIWAALLGILCLHALQRPGPASIVSATAFGALFVVIHVQTLVMYWSKKRGRHSLSAKLQGSAFVSDIDGLPNRNYLLGELRREVRRARNEDSPFTLVVVSLETFGEVRERRGPAFANRAVHQLLERLRTSLRGTDLLVALGEAKFCVMLVDCSVRGAISYLNRLPGTLPVSDGKHMLEAPVTVQVAQYDMESFYATDVLREAEEGRPLRRKLSPQTGGRAA